MNATPGFFKFLKGCSLESEFLFIITSYGTRPMRVSLSIELMASVQNFRFSSFFGVDETAHSVSLPNMNELNISSAQRFRYLLRS